MKSINFARNEVAFILFISAHVKEFQTKDVYERAARQRVLKCKDV